MPEVWQHTNRVVYDIVSRYDIDAIHMDDYFYPYPIAGKEFPDEATYAKNKRGLNKDDWRRSNCDTIIKQLNATIRRANPGVQFGISPFGVWRNKSVDPRGSNTKAGQTNYDDLYADILLWLEKGWIDYVTPQIYWEHGHPLANYDEIIDWWNDNSYGKNLYIGHGIYRAGSNPGWKDKNEIPYQINRVRNLKNTNGSIYFSSKSFNTNANGWNDSLQQHYYQKPALLPTMPWLVQYAMETPTVIKKSGDEYTINNAQKTGIKQYAILKKEKEVYSVEAIVNGPVTSIQFKSLGIQKNPTTYYWLVAIGHQNQLSKLVLLP